MSRRTVGLKSSCGKRPLGAAAALLLVVALGVVLHRPVAMIPENTLKFVVGVLLWSFGTFWIGEDMGLGRAATRRSRR